MTVSEGNRPRPRILIVEDEMVLAMDLSRALTGFGYEVVGQSASAEEALRLAAECGPDVVLMDISLRGEIDGITAAQEIRTRFEIPVIYLTGYAEKDVLERAKRTEPYGYLSKPVSMMELRSTIETALYRHRSDKRVRESEERFQLAMDAASDGIWDWDIPTGNTYYSPGYFAMLGLRAGEYPERFTSWLDLMHPEDREQAWQVNQDCIRGKTESFAVEFRMRHKDGSWRWILDRGKSVARDASGTAIRLVGTHSDITDRKLAEEALADNFSMIENLIDRAADGFAVCHNILEEPYVRFTHWNPVMTEITGYTVEEINRSGWYQTVYPDPEVRQRAMDRMDRMRVGDDLRAEEWVITTKSGEKKSLSISTSVISQETDKVHVLALMRDVTEQSRAVKELARTKENWERTFDTVRDFIMILDDRQRIVRLNRAAAEAFGLSHAEAIGAFCFKAVHGTPERPALCPFEKLSRDLGEHSEEVFIERLQRTFDVTVSPIIDPTGNLRGCIHVARDITDRKKKETELHEKTLLLQSLIEALPDLVHFKDAERRFLAVNKAWVEFFRVDRKDTIGRTVEEVLAPDIAEHSRRGDEEILKSGAPLFDEHSYNRLGEEVIFETRKFPVHDDKGGIIAIGGISRDITDRKKAAAAIAEAEHKYRLLVESAGEAILVAQDGTIKFANPRCVEWSGFSEEEILHKPFLQFVHPDDREMVVAHHLRRMQGDDSVIRYEARICDKEGKMRWFFMSSVPFSWEGRPAGLCFMTDVTERKRVDEQIRASLQEKEVLLREIHHRVKNNLAVISSLINLQAGHATDAAHREMFEDCVARIRSMALAHQLLYRSENLADIRIRPYVRDLVDQFTRSIGIIGSGIAFKQEIEEVSFSLDTSIPLGFILTELVSNCLKHAFPHGEGGEIAISLQAAGEREFHLIVKDNGIGISQAVDLKNPNSLGLELVETFVRQLGGAMEILRNRGTEVRIGFKERRR